MADRPNRRRERLNRRLRPGVTPREIARHDGCRHIVSINLKVTK